MRNVCTFRGTSICIALLIIVISSLIYGNGSISGSAASTLPTHNSSAPLTGCEDDLSDGAGPAKDIVASSNREGPIFNSLAATTSTITGRIVRQDNPNVGIANVLVDTANRSGSGISARTNADGYFTLKLRSDAPFTPSCGGGSTQNFVITPISSGSSGYVFSPSFRTVSMTSQGGIDFRAAAKPTGSRPPLQPDFRLPVPLGDVRQAGGVDWKVTCEVGGYCGPLGADSCHTNSGSGFYALDIKGSAETPIIAAADGDVMEAKNGGGWGNYILIRHDNGYYTRYAHLPRPAFVNSGRVSRGQLIGVMGSSGVSTGVHLHFQIYYGGSAITNSQSTTSQLRGIQVQYTPLVNYPAESIHKSTNPGPFTVTYPNGNESLPIGSTQIIRWKYVGDKSSLGTLVKIELLKGANVHSVIHSGISIGNNGSGSYNWIVPQLPSGSDYKIRVVSTLRNLLSDSSEADFRVRPGMQVLAASTKQGTALIPWGEDDGKKIPLILIHGIHGSDNTPDITTRNDYWSAFMAKFNEKALGSTYVPYVFQYYSDQEGVQEIASHLGHHIDDLLPDRPHVLLAHSMGGLVAKSYMVHYQHRTGKWSNSTGGDSTLLLITLATPHHGTPGANDPSALKQYMGTGWYRFFNSVNFLYWSKSAGFLSPPSLNSGTYNRSDLRWDNYDNALLMGNDVNLWLGPANRRFMPYSPKVIAYGGALKPVFPNLTAAGAFAQIPAIAAYNDHQRLQFANESMLYGLSRKFGITDGLVPYYSALLCDPGPFIGPPDNNFICLSPVRVRRFEPGNSGELQPDAKTLSITRRPLGYDHKHMYEHPDVLKWVIKDLTIEPKAVVSTSLRLSPNSNPYFTEQSMSGTFSVTNRGNADLVMRNVLIGGRLAGTCPNNICPDFGPVGTNITLKSGQTYNYSGSFTPQRNGTYTFSVAYQKPDGSWIIPVDSENGTINRLNVNVQSPLAKVVVSSSLQLWPNTPYLVGQTVKGTFSIANRGTSSVLMSKVLVGGRLGSTCPNNVCPDFTPANSNIALAPGQAYSYSGSFTFTRAGTYEFYVAYQRPDGSWVVPVDPENGTRNRQTVVVQNPAPTLTNMNPAYISASLNDQTVYLSGTGLTNTNYCYLQYPNGQGRYLYISLGQVFGRSYGQIGIKTRFVSRGRYFIKAYTWDGAWSNALPIDVH